MLSELLQSFANALSSTRNVLHSKRRICKLVRARSKGEYDESHDRRQKKQAQNATAASRESASQKLGRALWRLAAALSWNAVAGC